MTLIHLRVDDVLPAVEATIQLLEEACVVQFETLVELQLAPGLLSGLFDRMPEKQAEEQARRHPHWLKFYEPRATKIKHLKAIRKACEMSASSSIYLSLDDFKMANVGSY